MRIEHKSVALLALLLFGISSAVANSRSTFEYKVPRDFVVRVTLGTEPLSGSEVRIESSVGSPEKTTVVRSAICDSQGEATFSNIKPGRYYLSVRYAGIENGGSGDLMVLTDHHARAAERVLSISWAEAGFESTQRLAGRFTIARSILPKTQSTPVVGSIKVVEFRSSKVVGEGIIDENGRFEFSNVEEGYFIIEIAGDPRTWPASWPNVADMFVRVNRQAKRSYLSASISLTDAGLAFVFEDENE